MFKIYIHIFLSNLWWSCDGIWHWRSWSSSGEHSGYGFSQLGMTLQCNIISHWLSPYPEWSVITCSGNGLSHIRHQSFTLTNVYLTLWSIFQWNFIRNWNIFIQENAFENVVCKMAAILFQPHVLMHLPLVSNIYVSELDQHWFR